MFYPVAVTRGGAATYPSFLSDEERFIVERQKGQTGIVSS